MMRIDREAHFLAAALALGLLVGLGSTLRAQAPATQAPAAPAAVVPAQPALEPAVLEKKIDELLAAHAKVNGFSGSVLLASRGVPLFAKGVGHANVEWQIPNTPKTKFRIGSMTKQFTSMLIMQLRELGLLAAELGGIRRTHLALFSARGMFDDGIIVARDAGRVLCYTATDLM